MPFSSQAFFSASEVQILSAVVKPSAMTSLTFSGKIACGSSTVSYTHLTLPTN